MCMRNHRPIAEVRALLHHQAVEPMDANILMILQFQEHRRTCAMWYNVTIENRDACADAIGVLPSGIVPRTQPVNFLAGIPRHAA